jgi:hypothetical protein
MRHLRFSAVSCVILCLAACSSAVEQEGAVDPRACAQSYEFGNTGCIEVTGTVLGLRQQGLPGIIVGPVYLPTGEAFNTVYGQTDVSGRFIFRIQRFTPARGLPDTVSFYVRAADPSSAGVGIPARVRDSLLITATVTPVGRVPVPTTVALVLLVP